MQSQTVSNASASLLHYGSPVIICQSCGVLSSTGKIYWEMMTELEQSNFESKILGATIPNSVGYSLIPGLFVGFSLNEVGHLSSGISFLGGLTVVVLITAWLIPRKRKQKVEFLRWFRQWVPDEVKAADARHPGYREELKLRSVGGTRSAA